MHEACGEGTNAGYMRPGVRVDSKQLLIYHHPTLQPMHAKDSEKTGDVYSVIQDVPFATDHAKHLDSLFSSWTARLLGTSTEPQTS